METATPQPAIGAPSTLPLDGGVDHDDFDADQVLPAAPAQHWRKPAPEDAADEPPRRRVSKSLSVEPLTVCGIDMGCDRGPSLFDYPAESAPTELPAASEAKTYDEWIARPAPGSFGRGDPANCPVEWTGGASVPDRWSELPIDPKLSKKRADDDAWRRLADADDARSSEDELFQRWLRRRRMADKRGELWQQRVDDDDDDDAQAAAHAEAPCPENPDYPIDANDPNGWREWLRCFKKEQAGGQGLHERICFKRRSEALPPEAPGAAPAPAFAVTSQPQMVLEASAPEPTARQPDIGGEDIDIGPDDWPPPPDHETCDI